MATSSCVKHRGQAGYVTAGLLEKSVKRIGLLNSSLHLGLGQMRFVSLAGNGIASVLF